MIKRISAYALFIVGALIVAFFKNYNGTLISYSWFFYLIGIVCWLLGYLLLRKGKTFKEQKDIKKIKEFVDDLKVHGEKIEIPLNECEIKENNYSEERDRYKSREMLEIEPNFEGDIQFWNGLYDSSYNVKMVDVNQSVLIYKYMHNGAEEKFISKVIPRTKQDLNFKFYIQKKTFLYVDKNNRKRYYFDLEFLNPEE